MGKSTLTTNLKLHTSQLNKFRIKCEILGSLFKRQNQYLFKIFDYLFLITHPTRLGALSKRDIWTMHYFYILIPLCTKTIVVARIDLDENINFREIDCFHLFYDDRTWRSDQFWVDFTTNNFVQIIHRGKNSCKPFTISKSIYLENTMIMNFFRHKFFMTWEENFFYRFNSFWVSSHFF